MARTNNITLLSSEPKYEMVKHIIDVGALEYLSCSDYSIYKVPYNLRNVNNEAYTPQWISIGPIHLHKKKLKAMQEHKKRYFHFFWERVSDEHAIGMFKDYLESEEEKIRGCYAEKFPDIEKPKFVEMMLLDGVFIMEHLLRNTWSKSECSKHELEYRQPKSFRDKHGDDPIMTQPWLSRNITRDLILLENQIPFFVLQKLYDDLVPEDIKKQHSSFVDLAKKYFELYDTQMFSSEQTKNKNQSRKHIFSGSLCRVSKTSSSKGSKDGCDEPKHFTDLIRNIFLPTGLGVSSECADHVLRTATKLQDSGVTFEKDLKRRLLHITFDKKRFLSSFLCLGCIPYLNHFKARFRIPQLKVNHTTECVFRNLIAFEQCHYPEKPYICNYVSLIDSLIHTQLDVELLVEKEVIVHELGSDKEVATLVNGLSKHVVANSTCYYKTIDELNKHYQNTWNRTMAALRLIYFRDPWRASSTVVGIAVLVFAVFQFIRAIRAIF